MIDEFIKERKRKTEILKNAGVNPYPTLFKRSFSVGDLLNNFSKIEKAGKKVFIAGRIRALRDQGKILFADVEDFSSKIQIVIKKYDLKNFSVLKSCLDVGDFVGISGRLFKTKKGEKSVEVVSAQILTKSLRPIPSDFYGIEDFEVRLRKRYLDTILNKDTRDLFVRKTKFWKSVREYLDGENFLEVETPVLEATPGGAEAEPFVTHHNALDEDFYLRISLEISLKKIMVGGFEKIYEIGRIFRNEGIDAEHLQDYTQLELYWAYADYNELMKFIEKMYKFVIKKTFGSLKLDFNDKKIDWSKKWKVIDYCKIFKEKNNGLDPLTATKDVLVKRAKELGAKIDPTMGNGRLIDLIYKKSVRPFLIEPCFLINPPALIEPLAKRSLKNPEVVERFQVLAYGTELGKGFSEANDPQDQRERFEDQMKLRNQGDVEAQMLDEDFLEALEYGMPPTAGFGLSERLFSVLAQKPIREMVFFPPMKKENRR